MVGLNPSGFAIPGGSRFGIAVDFDWFFAEWLGQNGNSGFVYLF
jgi:hypothetical protein